MENQTKIDPKQITRQILIDNGFHRSPNTYYCVFTGEYMQDRERWSNQITQPKSEFIYRMEGVEPVSYGFVVVFDHGRLCEPSLLNFPKWATEHDFNGAFDRLKAFLNYNYVWEAGLAAGIHGD